MHYRKFVPALLTAVLCGWIGFADCSVARAEEHVLEEVTVTAERENAIKAREEKKPAAIQVYTSDDLKKMGAETAYDFLRNISGVNIMDFQGGCLGRPTITFRGQAVTNGGVTFSAFLDDVPMNDPGAAGPTFKGLPDLNCITPEMIDHVVVIKGPFSMDAGDFNTAGIFKFYTKKYTEKSSIKVEGGSYGYARGQLGLSGKLSEDFKHYTSIEYKRQDGFAENSGIDYYANVLSNVTYGDLDGDHTTLSVHFISYDAEVPGGLGKNEWDNGEWRMADNHTDYRDRDHIEAAVTNVWNVLPELQLRNIVWTRHWEGERLEDTELVWPGPQDDMKGSRANVGLRSQADYTTEVLGRYLKLSAGLDFRRDAFDIDYWTTDDRGNRQNRTKDFDGTYTQIAGFLKAEFDIVPSLRAYFGGRYDRIKYDVKNNLDRSLDKTLKSTPFSPKGGISWQATENVMFFAQGSTGSRTPDPQNADEGGVTKSLNFEAGSKGHFWDGRVNYMVAGYYTELKDINVRDPGSGEYLFAGDQEIPGVDVDLSVNIIEPITLWTAFGYNWAEWTKPEEDDGKGLIGVDPWTLSVGLDGEFDCGLRSRVEYRTNGKQWMDANYDRKEEDIYHIVNLMLNYRLTENLDTFVKINNLLNVRYCPWPAYDFYRPEPGINVKGGITFTF